MSESGFPLSRYDASEYPHANTRAQRFVDDVTFLRMARIRMPNAKPELGGLTSETIKQIHLADATLERWEKPEDVPTGRLAVDVAYRFPDGSLAVRIKATQRWEVWRTW